MARRALYIGAGASWRNAGRQAGRLRVRRPREDERGPRMRPRGYRSGKIYLSPVMGSDQRAEVHSVDQRDGVDDRRSYIARAGATEARGLAPGDEVASGWSVVEAPLR